MSDPSGARLGEFGRIERFFRPLAAGFPGAMGLENDAAVLSVPDGRELVVTTDAMVAGVHFLPDDSPADIAAKLLRVNLSDLAAMGAEPLAYTLATALPRHLGEDWLAAFAGGLAEDQARYGIALAGGDSVSTAGPVVLNLTAFGLIPKGDALSRRSARTDALLYVTGTIGDAALGLRAALGVLDLPLPAESLGHLVDRLRRPEPRLSVGVALRGTATACLDVSDGLMADVGHLARLSGTAAEVEAARVPLSAATRAALACDGHLMHTVLTGGDDYELAFAAPPGVEPILARVAAETGVAITRIGRLKPGPAGRVDALDATGGIMALESAGWTHF